MTATDNKAPRILDLRNSFNYPEDYVALGFSSFSQSYVSLESYDKLQLRLEKCEALLNFVFDKADLGKIHALDYYDADGDPVCKKWCSACEIIKRKEKYFTEVEGE